MKEYRDQSERGVVYTTIPDLKPVVAIAFAILGLLSALGYLAMKGEVVAIVILSMVGTTVLIAAGSQLSNSARKSEIETRATQTDEELARWRLNATENIALLEQQAKAQGHLSLSQSRLAHKRGNDPLEIGAVAEDDIPPSIVLGSDVYGDLK